MARCRDHFEIRRGVALGAAISFHIAVLMLVLRPAINEPGAATERRSNHQALQLRLLRRQVSSTAHGVMPAWQAIAPAMHARAKPAPRPSLATTLPATSLSALKADAADTPTVTPGSQSTIGDGGFHERLLQAQRAYAIHGVPGSDTPFVAGIPLIDPKAQGVGAAVRRMQRLFGIASRHCIDVDVWRHLTPRELSARHVSPDEVDRVDHENHCNRPAGLSF
ncbi:MAG TPA: hypothetical protein VMV99_01215 [Rhodanobacter sp.]|nr:hypothetical protein [Rhodanobacter sp.]